MAACHSDTTLLVLLAVITPAVLYQVKECFIRAACMNLAASKTSNGLLLDSAAAAHQVQVLDQ